MKGLLITGLIVIASSFLNAENFGANLIKGCNNLTVNINAATEARGGSVSADYFLEAVKRGDLVLKSEIEYCGTVHKRYIQHYKGVEVYGTGIIMHYKAGKLEEVNGTYHMSIPDISVKPQIDSETAMNLCEEKLNLTKEFKEVPVTSMRREAVRKSAIVIYKHGKKFIAAYKCIVDRGPVFSRTAIMDAETGEILKHYSNVYFDKAKSSESLRIGYGYGFHGNKYKFPVTYDSEKKAYFTNYYQEYSTQSLTRPVDHYTLVGDGDMQRMYSGSLKPDDDGVWEDPAIADNHAWMGLTYDYYYKVHGRKGLDGNNMSIVSIVHAWGFTDNASFSPMFNVMSFYEPGKKGWNTASSLDVIAHEYTHGVLFHSGVYHSSIHEGFADIMATAVEHYYQPKGAGVMKADWIMGEDLIAGGLDKGIRNIANPQDHGNPKAFHIDHYDEKKAPHYNGMILSHSFYLLSEGGKHQSTGVEVTGIGIEKAAKIFYNGFTNYLNASSSMGDAANSIIVSAKSLYGDGSVEMKAAMKAVEAVGFKVQ